jgi:hypothetical protein
MGCRPTGDRSERPHDYKNYIAIGILAILAIIIQIIQNAQALHIANCCVSEKGKRGMVTKMKMQRLG